jgi:hypothetical protein
MNSLFTRRNICDGRGLRDTDDTLMDCVIGNVHTFKKPKLHFTVDIVFDQETATAAKFLRRRILKLLELSSSNKFDRLREYEKKRSGLSKIWDVVKAATGSTNRIVGGAVGGVGAKILAAGVASGIFTLGTLGSVALGAAAAVGYSIYSFFSDMDSWIQAKYSAIDSFGTIRLTKTIEADADIIFFLADSATLTRSRINEVEANARRILSNRPGKKQNFIWVLSHYDRDTKNIFHRVGDNIDSLRTFFGANNNKIKSYDYSGLGLGPGESSQRMHFWLYTNKDLEKDIPGTKRTPDPNHLRFCRACRSQNNITVLDITDTIYTAFLTR